jgi:hypothetical protein
MTTINDVLLIQSTELLVILDKFKIENTVETLNLITLGQRESDNINPIFTITDTKHLIWLFGTWSIWTIL